MSNVMYIFIYADYAVIVGHTLHAGRPGGVSGYP